MAEAKISIDGKEFLVPVMKFKTLKKSYPIIQSVLGEDDPIAMASKAIEIISLAMMQEHHEMTADWLEDNMLVSETKDLDQIMMKMIVDSGLIDQEGFDKMAGEAKGSPAPAEPENPSTEILTSSLPNSSQPDVVEETGT